MMRANTQANTQLCIEVLSCPPMQPEQGVCSVGWKTANLLLHLLRLHLISQGARDPSQCVVPLVGLACHEPATTCNAWCGHLAAGLMQ